MFNSESRPIGEFELLRHPRYEGQIVRPALKQEHAAAWVGFSLGKIFRKEEQCRFDFALPTLRFQRLDGLDWQEKGDLRSFFPAALEVAHQFDREVVGLWAAWSHAADTEKLDETTRDSWLAAEAVAFALPFVSLTPIDGYCRWWRTWISRAEEFPDKSRRAKRTKGRPCPGPLDNPRRVKAAWHMQLEMKSLLIP